MRCFFKTDYNQDLALFRDSVDRFWYALLLVVLLAAPFVLEDFWLGEISHVFILSVVGLGLMILTGFTGQEIGSASCTERVCPYVSISLVPAPLKKKTAQYHDE